MTPAPDGIRIQAFLDDLALLYAAHDLRLQCHGDQWLETPDAIEPVIGYAARWDGGDRIWRWWTYSDEVDWPDLLEGTVRADMLARPELTAHQRLEIEGALARVREILRG